MGFKLSEKPIDFNQIRLYSFRMSQNPDPSKTSEPDLNLPEDELTEEPNLTIHDENEDVEGFVTKQSNSSISDIVRFEPVSQQPIFVLPEDEAIQTGD